MDYSIFPSKIIDIAGVWTMLMIMTNVWSIVEFKKRKEMAGFILGIGAFVISLFLFEMEILSCHLSGYGR